MVSLNLAKSCTFAVALIGDVTGRTDSLFRERSHDAIFANLAGNVLRRRNGSLHG
jgi:hypothetical protein